jgi:arylsulfatase A-like enzyme
MQMVSFNHDCTPRVPSPAAMEGEGRPSTDTGPLQGAERSRPGREPLTPASAIGLAMALGLCAGYLDVAIIIFKKFCWNPEGYYRIARDFPWSVPANHAVLMALAGGMLAALVRLRPGLVSLRAGAWLLATLAIWGALLRMPMYGACSLLLAGGLGRPIGGAIAAQGLGSRRVRLVAAALVGALVVLAAASSGWQVLRESRAVAALPAAPRARNVILIVWDTVRARNLGLYGYDRPTTTNLAQWADRGITYHFALAPAPWTFPSHTCFFTGQWPLKLDSQWKPRLDTPDPTLAEYLASRGYQTAGFAANTNCCTYESGLGRGFAHYEDYSLTPASLLARTVPGKWLIEQALDLVGDYNGEKWATLQSRDASGINGAFLDWLGRRRVDRPFFAFLNYFDAHDTYIPPPGFVGRFGIRPGGRQDYRFLLDYESSDKALATKREFIMARDCYDDCVAYLDDQLGRLLDELGRRGILDDTEVIITSDHGEAFGEHGLLGHSNSVKSEEIRIPLVMLSPGAPAGARVYHPVSLRDLPATVVDRLGLADGSPFPGHSLAVYWGLPPGRTPRELTTPAFTEQANRSARLLLRPQAGPGGSSPGFRMSLYSWNLHYTRDGEGHEELYDALRDPIDKDDLIDSADHQRFVQAFRALLLNVLTESPGSPAVEETYLKNYRQSLESLVRGGSAPGVLSDRRIGADRAGPSRRPAS